MKHKAPCKKCGIYRELNSNGLCFYCLEREHRDRRAKAYHKRLEKTKDQRYESVNPNQIRIRFFGNVKTKWVNQ